MRTSGLRAWYYFLKDENKVNSQIIKEQVYYSCTLVLY